MVCADSVKILDFGLAKFATALQPFITGQKEALARTMDRLFADDIKAEQTRFSQAAAGKKWHHEYRGGLVRHVYEMARIALTVCELYPELDRDMLLTDAEKASNAVMMICCSGSKSPRLVLDI